MKSRLVGPTRSLNCVEVEWEWVSNEQLHTSKSAPAPLIWARTENASPVGTEFVLAKNSR